jgi:Gamma-glutamyltransferase
VLAAGGGRNAVAALTLGILRCVRGAPLHDIVSAPRFALTYGPNPLRMEAGAFDPAERRALQHMGYRLHTVHHPLGRLQAILWAPADNQLDAATDPRGSGAQQRLMLHPVPRCGRPSRAIRQVEGLVTASVILAPGADGNCDPPPQESLRISDTSASNLFWFLRQNISRSCAA